MVSIEMVFNRRAEKPSIDLQWNPITAMKAIKFDGVVKSLKSSGIIMSAPNQSQDDGDQTFDKFVSIGF